MGRTRANSTAEVAKEKDAAHPNNDIWGVKAYVFHGGKENHQGSAPPELPSFGTVTAKGDIQVGLSMDGATAEPSLLEPKAVNLIRFIVASGSKQRRKQNKLPVVEEISELEGEGGDLGLSKLEISDSTTSVPDSFEEDNKKDLPKIAPWLSSASFSNSGADNTSRATSSGHPVPPQNTPTVIQLSEAAYSAVDHHLRGENPRINLVIVNGDFNSATLKLSEDVFLLDYFKDLEKDEPPQSTVVVKLIAANTNPNLFVVDLDEKILFTMVDAAMKGAKGVNGVQKYINATMRITTNDGRMFEGTLKCVDRENNMVLATTHEYKVAEPTPGLIGQPPTTMSSRYLGLIVIMGRDIVKIEQRLGIGNPGNASDVDAMDESGGAAAEGSLPGSQSMWL